jgi:hypothetical protein
MFRFSSTAFAALVSLVALASMGGGVFCDSVRAAGQHLIEDPSNAEPAHDSLSADGNGGGVRRCGTASRTAEEVIAFAKMVEQFYEEEKRSSGENEQFYEEGHGPSGESQR